jgi:hypothetical protein
VRAIAVSLLLIGCASSVSSHAEADGGATAIRVPSEDLSGIDSLRGGVDGSAKVDSGARLDGAAGTTGGGSKLSVDGGSTDPSIDGGPAACDPVHAQIGTNGCDDGLACYLVVDEASGVSSTECLRPLGYADCFTFGAAVCSPGYVCGNPGRVDPGCWVTCRVDADCPTGERCFPINLGSVYGGCL